MLSTIMTDPFAPAAPATLLSAIQTLQAVLANCWPRIPKSAWQDEIINILVLCWLNLSEPGSSVPGPVRASLKQELSRSAKALAAVLETADISLSKVVAPLVAKEASLAGLFSW